jgi:hypothetical protein
MNLILTSCLPENKWVEVRVGMRWDGEEGSCNCVNKSIVSFALPLFLTHQHRPWTILLRGEIVRYTLREEHLCLGECRDATSYGAVVIASVQGAVILLLQFQ